VELVISICQIKGHSAVVGYGMVVRGLRVGKGRRVHVLAFSFSLLAAGTTTQLILLASHWNLLILLRLFLGIGS